MSKKNILLTADVIHNDFLIVIDQITKYFAVLNLKGVSSWVLWDGVFELHYLENRGAAFGILQDQKMIFILIAVVVLAVIFYVLFKAPYQKMYSKLHISLILIAAGAIGNLIDRVRLGYVVDFFYFSLINFPVFNVADIYVTVSSFYLVILLLLSIRNPIWSF